VRSSRISIFPKSKDEIIEIKGSVYDTEGNPAEDASVDIW
tara:strand:+ start:15052 stop:15171 length:120 start_codon:yes stop_codon:yes gene_type:complete